MNQTNKNGADTLKINEIFYSIQGESTHSGRPCVFVRLTYCNLRCSYCDTEYAFFEGRDLTVWDILGQVKEYDCNLVEITGGEPLIQEQVYPLMEALLEENYEVLLETGGHMDISRVDQRVKRIVDLKCPTSNESEKVHWENIPHLRPRDEIKFVVGSREDFEWAQNVIREHRLETICPVIFSPVKDKVQGEQLAAWILESRLAVRMQLQLHKILWPGLERGI